MCRLHSAQDREVRIKELLAKLLISAEERRELKAQLSARNAPEDEKLRILIVLACANGLPSDAPRSIGFKLRRKRHDYNSTISRQPISVVLYTLAQTQQK